MAGPSPRARGGLGRTLLVAGSTLAILAVIYLLYESAPSAPQQPAAAHHRLPPVPAEVPPDRPPVQEDQADRPVATVGGIPIGEGAAVRFVLYDREGTNAVGEVEAAATVPVAGAPNELGLVNPVVRLRSSSGHAIRASAKEGALDIGGTTGEKWKPRWGRLTSEVVIEIDRLTEAERAKLPTEQRDHVDPAHLVRIELDRIEFDRDYAKVVVDGPLRLTAVDADLEAANVEVRFNETLGRVESARFDAPGRFELRDVDAALGASLPRVGSEPARRATLVEWMRDSLEAKLAARDPQQPPAQPPAPRPAAERTDTGLPIFHLTKEKKERDASATPIKYHARFEGKVEARRSGIDAEQSVLFASVLEILRDFSEQDRQRARSAVGSPARQQPSPDEAGSAANAERIAVSWTDRLVVKAVAPGDALDLPGVRSRIVATGSPVRIESPQGSSTAQELVFNPDGSVVTLLGTPEDPVRARAPDQGLISGIEVHSRQEEDRFEVRVVGPGFLTQALSASEIAATDGKQPQSIHRTPRPTKDTSAVDSAIAARIDFGTEMMVRGRVVRNTAIDWRGGPSGAIATRETRLIDSAEFTGRARIRDADTTMAADTLTAEFTAAPAGRSSRQAIQRVRGNGDVVMTQGGDRVTCDTMDITLDTEEDGSVVPRTAVAEGNVVATQGERSIQAAETLVVDFTRLELPPEPFDPAQAYREAKAAGEDPSTIDWDERRRHESAPRRRIGVSTLRAEREVRVTDPSQGLDITADTLDCTVVNGREIQKAQVIGLPDRPAFVQHEALTVVGEQIKLDLEEDWAEVPGAGRLTFRSKKDLDGKVLAEPIPVSVTWDEAMRYQGDVNEARFVGGVHATSESTTTFDCDELLILFEDAPVEAPANEPKADWWILSGIARSIDKKNKDDAPRLAQRRIAKQPLEILATGQAVAVTTQLDEISGDLESRARISGPRLRVDLRPDVSKMLIEGSGDLLLEDFRPARSGRSARTGTGLFELEESDGPSKTLIQWSDLMWYDFAHNQTQFQGAVDFKHFSGAELEKLFGQATSTAEGQSPVGGEPARRSSRPPQPDAGRPTQSSRVADRSIDAADTPASRRNTQSAADPSAARRRGQAAPPGRRVFLTCQELTVDFLKREESSRSTGRARFGGLSAARLRRFQAKNDVILNDPSEGVWLSAALVIFERDRDLLVLYGPPNATAQIIRRRPGENPVNVHARRIDYNIRTNTFNASQADIRG